MSTSIQPFYPGQHPGAPENIGKGVAKVLAFSAIAAAVTFSLFVLMDRLTRIDGEYQEQAGESILIDPVFAAEDKPVITRKVLPEPPKPMEKPDVPELEPMAPNDEALGEPNYDPNSLLSKFSQSEIPLFSPTEGDAKPVVRVEPKYPMEAARDGIQGWVKLVFDINSQGAVENVRVLDAEPKRIFDSEAKRALLRWKYQPKVENGKPVMQSGQTVMLSFNLEG
ncbi:energy transducer TonB [Aliiglaciecola sp. CAU 1673]|uniref:energy transducer TonB n=1 Tax=Aliiglaciecola sp. CAU 1673 TaxID=3032595 RepID=UPI0023DBEDCD|nr:energy transducer TonB [Aliiglaciecola sp. CAU 1673]MDF2178647.1 energy transducer TonB [Aliiglaciecola sp. CAU 1673]